jgi:cyclophilin family peptidyl-prolyl cis-trans isomerase
VSKKPNNSDRARRARQASKFERRTSRNRVVIIIMAILMALSLLAIPISSFLADRNQPDPVAIDDPDAVEAPEEPEPIDPADVDDPCPEPTDVPQVDAEIRDEPFERTIDEDAVYEATIETSCGTIVIELDAAGAPEAVNNLVNLAEAGYYDGVIFHRIVPGFVVQAGDPAGTGCGQEECGAGFDPDAPSFPGYTFADELETAEQLFGEVQQEQLPALREELEALEEEGVDLSEIGIEGEPTDEELLEFVPGGYPRGTLAMANAGPDTNGSQFFITHGDPTALPQPLYTVFGTVLEGLDVVDDIAASTTDASDRPVIPPTILSVTIAQR